MKPSSDTINILGFHTTTLNRTMLLKLIEEWLIKKKHSHHLMALNPIKICRARREPELANYIKNADVVYPDAYGIAWAMNRISGKCYKSIPGCDLMYDVLNIAHNQAISIFLLGSKEEVIKDTKTFIEKKYPSIKVVGFHNGYFNDDLEINETLHTIINTNPGIVLVGMGAMIQERWIERILKSSMENNVVIPLLMGVGGSFDALTGHVPRPPKWMLKMNLEWFYRLIKQPLRAPRMLALPHFALLVLGKKYFKLNLDYV